MTTNTFLPILANAVADVTETLRSFAADPLFAEKFNLVFGTVVSAEQFLQVVAVLPEIEVLADGELNGALGAFSAQTGKIYLSEALVTGDVARLRSVLIEEIGHFVDAQVNTTDMAGDEGELFSALVRGGGLSSTELSRIKTEDDHAVVVIGGQAMEIEQSTWTINQLTNNIGEDDLVRVSGNNVVWRSYEGGSGNSIYLYNGTETFRLTDNGTEPEISGNNVVWAGSDGIYFYNGTSTFLLPNSNGGNKYQISGNNVIWQAWDGNDLEIYLYNGTATIQITNNNTNDQEPQISGNNAVWSGSDGIYFYNGTSTVLLPNSSGGITPKVSGNNVAWQGGDFISGTGSAIYFYNGAETITLAERGTQLQLSGNNVVWGAGGGEIYLYNGTTTLQLTNNNTTDQAPQVSGNNVVWFGTEIYLYNGTTTFQLTNNTIYDQFPQISGNNVVWLGIDGDTEIFQTFINNTNTIAFSNSQFSVNEDGTPVNQVTLTRTEGSTGEVSVTLNLTDGTATADNDYNGIPITVTFADGETSKTVDIPIVNDNLPEINETLNLTLSNPSNGATLGTQTTASLTIIDNDINNATLLNPANFTVNGSAKFGIGIDGVSSILRLTDDYWQSGSAFLTNAINLSNNASFSSYFKFQITDSQGLGDEDGPGADGLVFTIQTIANNVGADGGGIGYAGINQSLGVEFDTFNNGEINGNHVGIDINGDINSVTAQLVADRLNNGNIWSAWIDYNGVSDLLEVRISETNLRPSTALLSYTVDLPSILTTNDAFIGFTSGTGGGTGDHDILDWQFNNSYSPITEIANSELDFSGVQGLNNWYYGYYDGPFDSSDFQQMTQFNGETWTVQDGTYWTRIDSMATHGNGIITSQGRTPVEQWAVRRWMSEANGTIQIQGHLAKTGMGGNGVIGRIFVDGVEIWSQFIDGYDSTGITYQVEAVVNLNSIVDFALDPSESNDLYDTTIFTAQIKGIESDSPGILSFSSPQFSINEDGTPVNQVTLTRTGGSAGEVSVTLNLTDGTATADNDYDGTPLTVTFADGEISKTVNIPIIDDIIYEGDETLNLTLSDPTGGATLGTQQTAILNIVDNETPPPPSLLQVRINLLKDNGGNPGEIINNDQIGLYQSFFVEIVVGDFRDNAVGVNGLQLDFNWDGFILESINSPFDPANIITSQFPLLQGGSLDNPNGLINDLSGGSLPDFELGQAIGINQLDRFALLHFYAENITDGTSYFTTTVDSVSLADDASYTLDVETAQPIAILGSTISITDNSGDANDARIRFTTELSQFRKNYQDSNLIRPNYADSRKYFDIINTGSGTLTISELRINVAGVSTDLDLTQGDLLLNPNESQRVNLTYSPSAAREVFDRSDALVLVTNAINAPELAIALAGQSTFNADINYDGKVGVGDLGSLNQGKANLNKGIYDPTADINGDGLFNSLDVTLLQSENKLSLFA